MNLSSKPAIALFLVGLAALCLQAQEKKIRREQLPSGIEKTVAAEECKGATVKGFATEVENGHKFYEAELTANGDAKDISMDEKGNIVEVEQEVSLDSLSPDVKKASPKPQAAETSLKSKP